MLGLLIRRVPKVDPVLIKVQLFALHREERFHKLIHVF